MFGSWSRFVCTSCILELSPFTLSRIHECKSNKSFPQSHIMPDAHIWIRLGKKFRFTGQSRPPPAHDEHFACSGVNLIRPLCRSLNCRLVSGSSVRLRFPSSRPRHAAPNLNHPAWRSRRSPQRSVVRHARNRKYQLAACGCPPPRRIYRSPRISNMSLASTFYVICYIHTHTHTHAGSCNGETLRYSLLKQKDAGHIDCADSARKGD